MFETMLMPPVLLQNGMRRLKFVEPKGFAMALAKTWPDRVHGLTRSRSALRYHESEIALANRAVLSKEI